MACSDLVMTRRGLLHGAGTLTAWSMIPRVASAAGSRDPRFLLIILRGALDGLNTLVPTGDPDWARLRDDAHLRVNGVSKGLPLDGFFTLNPSLPTLYELYRAKQAALVHAVATPYRGRSHFAGQHVLESGLPDYKRNTTGWMNRLIASLPTVGAERVAGSGLSVGPVVPLIMRGAAPVTAWSAEGAAPQDDDTVDRLLALYDRTEPVLHRAFAQAVEAQRMTVTSGQDRNGSRGLAARFARMARGAGRLMAVPEGPRVATMSFDGWDTHASQGPLDGQLARRLAALDAAIAALQESLAPVWQNTVVTVVTEFGRTVHENGNDGTDHGTGTTALLFGGAVQGGRIITDWPGLSPESLWENRDLRPTTDLRAVLKAVAEQHLGVSETTLATDIFPETGDLRAVQGLF